MASCLLSRKPIAILISSLLTLWLIRVVWINCSTPVFCENVYSAEEHVRACSSDAAGTLRTDAVECFVKSAVIEDQDSVRAQHPGYYALMGRFEAEGEAAIVLVGFELSNTSDEVQLVNLSDYYLCSDGWFNAVDYYYLTGELGCESLRVAIGGHEKCEVELPYLICESQFADIGDMKRVVDSPMRLVTSRYPEKNCIELLLGGGKRDAKAE